MSRKKSLFWPVIIGILSFVLIRLLKVRKQKPQPITKEVDQSIMLENQKAAPPPMKPAQEEPKQIDDLRKIEGIGPKISKILVDTGIYSFKHLSTTAVEELRAILDESNIRIADPTTWPEQAVFAANKDWEGLKSLQKQLKGGRREGVR